MEYADDQLLFPLIREPASRWERAGLNARQERWFNLASAALVVLFGIGWAGAITARIIDPPDALDVVQTPMLGADAGRMRDPLARPSVAERITDEPLAPALTAAVLRSAARDYAKTLDREVRGLSGAIYVQILRPGEQPKLPSAAKGKLAFRVGGRIADQVASSGVFDVVLQEGAVQQEVPNLSVIRMLPMSVKTNGRVGRYRIGSWPCERGNCPANPIYRTPAGLIEVTPENKEIFLSEHIQLKDYITKLQESVWPKYVVVDPQNLDKIELVVQELERMGHPVRNLFAVSGFRSPWYNAGGGNTAGRGQLSRHMYGDAMDIAVDNDRNGLMDDLNGDGRINLADARVIGEAVDRVERKYPSLVGGMHYYPPTGGHRGMVHIDTRGNRARW
jgi:uncharacterized protein YcbK (DUF882 family)